MIYMSYSQLAVSICPNFETTLNGVVNGSFITCPMEDERIARGYMFFLMLGSMCVMPMLGFMVHPWNIKWLKAHSWGIQ